MEMLELHSEVSHKHNNHMIILTNLRTLLDYLWSVLIIFNTAQLRFYHCPLWLYHCTNLQCYPLILGPAKKPSHMKTSVTSHTLRGREEGYRHAATIELLPRQRLDVTNHICALHRSHPLS